MKLVMGLRIKMIIVKLFIKIKHFLSHPLLTIKVRGKGPSAKIERAIKYCFYKLKYGKNVILFESHYVFDGNSGALYKYLRSKRKYNKYTFVWLVKGYIDGTVKNTRHDLFFSLENQSGLKKYLCGISKFAFYDDVPIKAGAKSGKTIHLSHGQLALKNIKGIIKTPDYVNYALCISEHYKPYFCQDIGCPPEKIFICGLPRNDILFSEKVDVSTYFETSRYEKIILWLPTFRKVNWCDRNDETKELPFGIPLFYTEDQIKMIDNFLKDKNILLVLKLHPVQDLGVIQINNVNNIIFIEHQSLIKNRIGTNYLYPYADAMISDYSSAATDFMLMDKPLAYIIEDQDNYKLKLPQELYNKRTPGTKIKTVDDLKNFLQSVFDGDDEFRNERREFVNYIHTYKDGENCKRIVKMFNI